MHWAKPIFTMILRETLQRETFFLIISVYRPLLPSQDKHCNIKISIFRFFFIKYIM